MKILLTGSQGYIGTRLSEILVSAGYEVTGLDTGFYRDCFLYEPAIADMSTINKDVRQISEEDLKGFEAVVHLAELSNDPLGVKFEKLTDEINHLATIELAKKSRQAGVKKFVYFSSCSVYGASDSISDEQSPVNPLTAYARAKAANEQGIRLLAAENFSPVFLRLATAFGASPRQRFDLAINNLAGVAFTTNEIKMQSDGSSWRPFVHIVDIAQAVNLVLKAPAQSVHNEILNVGANENNFQIKQIAGAIKERLPDCRISSNAQNVDKRNYRVNFDKITKVLPEFKCVMSVEAGIAELLEVFKRVNLKAEVFESKDYTRLKQIDHLLGSGQLDSSLMWKEREVV